MHDYPTTVKNVDPHLSYIFVDDDYDGNLEKLRTVYKPVGLIPKFNEKIWLCVNDGMNPEHPNNKNVRTLLTQWYLELFPQISQFENGFTSIKVKTQHYPWKTLYDKRNTPEELSFSIINQCSYWIVKFIIFSFIILVILPYYLTRIKVSVSKAINPMIPFNCFVQFDDNEVFSLYSEETTRLLSK